MVKQYPHTISFFDVTGGSIDDDGNPVAGEMIQSPVYACRFEKSGGNSFINAPDGTRVYYAGIVYLPLPAPPVKNGSMVEVKRGDTVLLNTRVLNFSEGQLNARVWL